METKALYLTNPLAEAAEGLVLTTGMDDSGSFIIVDQSPAYPQGGGQESDKGIIKINDLEYEFTKVKWVTKKMRHYITGSIVSIIPGDKASIVIDTQHRKFNSTLHSAGHLIACVINDLFPELIATKGHHYGSGSYIEFSGAVPETLELIKTQLELVLKVELKSLKKILVTYDKAPYEYVPERSMDNPIPFRFITIESYPRIPCGGTHVITLNEIPGIEIIKIKKTKGIIRISYSCHSISLI